MDLSYSEEQQLLKDSVDRFAKEGYPLDKRKKLVAGDLGHDEANWKMFAEQGWLAIGVPEAHGGIGGAIETLILMEGVGRGLIVEPVFATLVLGATAIRLAGNEAQQARILPGVVAGKTKLALAYAERQSRFNLADVKATAKEEGGGFVLDGRKVVVFGAPSADTLIVAARTSGTERSKSGISLFLVDAKAKGVSIRGYRNVDGQRAGDVTLAGVKVGADALLGQKDKGYATIEAVADHALAALCAEAVGCMQVLHDMTLEYLKTRQQFGQPIGRFQALQHRMADVFVALEHAKSMAIYAALSLSERSAKTRTKAMSAAKAAIGQAGRLIGQESVQMHGGMGMTDELAVGHYFKRLTMIDMTLGNADYHLQRFAEL
jgi:alkylation response protein AidB-like acyl-CoA dehydrogenase